MKIETSELNLSGMFDMQLLESAVTKSCLLVERDARLNAPVDTGELRNFIRSEVHTEGNTVTGEVGTPLSYAPYICFGTGLFAEAGNGRKTRWSYKTPDGKWHSTIGQNPQPFLRPALDNNKDKIIEIISKTIRGDSDV